MMPTVRDCSTPAGRVAYSTVGSGPPLLCETGWVSHLRGQLELFAFGSFIERLAERFTVIRYDEPGWACRIETRWTCRRRQMATALAVADAVALTASVVRGLAGGPDCRGCRGEVP